MTFTPGQIKVLRHCTPGQIKVLRYCANVQGDGWFYLPGSLGAAAAGLARRELIFSRLDQHRQRLVKLSPKGMLAAEELNK